VSDPRYMPAGNSSVSIKDSINNKSLMTIVPPFQSLMEITSNLWHIPIPVPYYICYLEIEET
jgi:hypothetical protein